MSTRSLLTGAVGLALVSIPGASALSAFQGFQIGMGVGGILFPEKGPQLENRLRDIRGTGASPGSPIPIVYGREVVGTNIIWATDVRHEHSEHGGKGEATTVTDSYFANVAFGVCDGPITRIRRIWANSDLIYDDRPDSPGYYERPAEPDGRRPKMIGYLKRSRITPYLGTETQLPDPLIEADKGVGNVPPFRGLCYFVFQNLPFHRYGGSMPQMKVEVERGGVVVTVDVIVNDLLDRIEFPAERRNLAKLAEISCEGYVVGSRAPVREYLDPLQGSYHFDFAEVDWNLAAIRRGGAAVITIPIEHLGCGSPDARNTLYDRTDPQGTELPSAVDVSFINFNNDYNAGNVSADRETAQKPRRILMDVPVVMEEQTARNLGYRTLYSELARARGYKIYLPYEYLRVTAGDVLNLPTEDGRLLRVQVIDCELTFFGAQEFTVVEDDETAYFASAPLIATTYTSTDIPDHATPLIFAADVNGLSGRDADYPSLYMIAADDTSYAGGQASTTPGLRGSDNVVRTDLARIVGTGTIGKLYANLAGYEAAAPWDMDSTVYFQVLRGPAPTSATDSDVLDGANAMIVGEEVLQFATVTPVSAGKFALTRLLRGRRGTEYAARLGASGDTKAAIVTGGVVRYAYANSETGGTRTITLREDGEEYDVDTPAPTMVAPLKGNARLPWGPAPVTATRNVGGDVALAWEYRSRYGGEMAEGGEGVELGEASELYDLQVWSAGYATLIRTVTGLTSPAYTYTAANQTTDFGSAQASIAFVVYQVSSVVGRGHPTHVIL